MNFRKISSEKRVKVFDQIVQNHLSTDFPIWFLPSSRWKEIQIEFGESVTGEQEEKSPNFDMLIKISENRFWVDEKTFSLMFAQSQVSGLWETEHDIKGSLVINYIVYTT
jgi:hypothetical protein